MDIQKYIESGILEEYCLGLLNEHDRGELLRAALLYPQVKAELTAVELAFEKLAALTAVTPAESVKYRVLQALDLPLQQAQLNAADLPVITGPQDPEPWLAAFGHLIPAGSVDSLNLHVVRQDAAAQQMIVTGCDNIAEEEHGEFYEGLLILKGRCQCTVGENFYSLGPGDFIEIPLHTKHDVKLLTPCVTAVLQYRFA